MRKRIKLLCMLFVLISIWAQGENRIFIEDFYISPGESKELSVIVNCDTAWGGLECFVKLPPGLNFTKSKATPIAPFGTLFVNKIHKEDYSETKNIDDAGCLRFALNTTGWSLDPPEPPLETGTDVVVATIGIKADDDYDNSGEILLYGLRIYGETMSGGMRLNDVSVLTNYTGEPDVSAVGVSLDKCEYTLAVGETGTLTASTLPRDASHKAVTWTTSNNEVATVMYSDKNTGSIKAIGTGTAIITATTTDGSNKSAVCVLTVDDPVLATSITLNKTSSIICLGHRDILSVMIMPEEATFKNVKWASNNTSVASVSSSGEVMGNSIGTAIITVTTTDGSNLSAYCEVNVVDYVTVSSVSLNATELSLKEGGTAQLTASVLPKNATNKSVTWSSSDENVATVDDNGLVTAEATGTAIITATANDGSGITSSCSVTVSPRTILVSSVELSQMELSLDEGETAQLTASVLPDNATDKSVTWSSSDENVATVDDNGLVAAVVAGTAIITATANDGSGITSSCSVTVSPRTILVSSVELSQMELSLDEGETAQLTASVLPDNATDKSVTWSSSDENVATVDDNGLVAAVAAGTATITTTANDGSGVSASCAVTVSVPVVVPPLANRFEISDTMTFHGDTIIYPVNLINVDEITAFQCDIYIPDGFSVPLDEDDEFCIELSDRKNKKHDTDIRENAGGFIRMICAASNSKPFAGNDGPLFFITLVSSSNLEGGEYPIQIKNIVLTTPDEEETAPGDVSALITVKDYIKGDANGNNVVNVTDVVTVYNYIQGANPKNFVLRAADVNESGTVNVTDVVGIYNIIQNGSSSAIRSAKGPRKAGEESDRLFVEDFQINPGEEKTVNIMLENSTAYTAFQFDMILPSGLTVLEDEDEELMELTDRAAKSHGTDIRQHEWGIRAICASSKSATFKGNDGALLTMIVKADNTFTDDAVIELKNIVFTEPDETEHQFNASTSIVTEIAPVVSDDVRVVAGRGVIAVSGTDNVKVYNAAGSLVSADVISYVAPGYYIVVACGKAHKVAVR